MPTYSAKYGLRLPTDPESPDMPQTLADYTTDLEAVLERSESKIVEAHKAAEAASAEAGEASVQAETALNTVATGFSHYAISFADSAGFEAGGFTDQAVLDLQKPPTIAGVGGVTAQPVDSDEWAFAVADSRGKIAFGVKQTGQIYPESASTFSGDFSKLASDLAGLTRSKTTAVTAVGDSLTYGFFDGRATGKDGWPETLKTLAPGVTVTNAAMSGFTADEAGIRAAFIQPLVTVAGGAIPASGEVAITVKDAEDYDWQNRSTATTVSIGGSLAGVPGVFKRTTAGAFSFTRSGTGAVTPVPADTPFIGGFPGKWEDTLVVFVGRNNVARNAYGTGPGSIPAQVLQSVKAIVAASTVGVKQALIVSVTTGTWERQGTSGYNTVKEINRLLAEEYPTRFFDLRSYLVKQAIYDLKLTPTSEDIASMENDTLPPSIMSFGSDGVSRDGVHYSRETAALVGRKIFEELKKRSWI